MDIRIVLLSIFLWLPQAIFQLLTWDYWWQDKEYRFDRFKILLFGNDGPTKLWTNLIALKILVIIFAILTKSFLLISLVFVISNIFFIIRFRTEGLRRPVFTQRARRIFYTSLAFIILTFIFFVTSESNLAKSWLILFGEISLILSPYIGILWTIPIVNKIKKEEIFLAKEKLAEVQPTVIGITGSYGKTTTKEFVAHLLSQKYEVAKTSGSENTEFGIARKTVQFVNKSTEFFVVEMGAYKRGEITRLANIVNPHIAILTGIEPQHLSLFGSLENIQLAKFELIEALPQNGMAFFNSTNIEVRKLADKARGLPQNLKVYEYGFDLKGIIKTQDVSKTIVEFSEESRKILVTVTLPGIHFIENLGLAILVARKLNVSWLDIKKLSKSLKLPDKTMQIRKLKSGAVVIDDSYNTTPKGFVAALNYLRLYEGKKKVIVTPGIIELGEESEAVHKNLGKLMKDALLYKILLSSHEAEHFLKEGLGSQYTKLELIQSSFLLEKKLNELSKKGCVILIEGRIPNINIK